MLVPHGILKFPIATFVVDGHIGTGQNLIKAARLKARTRGSAARCRVFLARDKTSDSVQSQTGDTGAVNSLVVCDSSLRNPPVRASRPNKLSRDSGEVSFPALEPKWSRENRLRKLSLKKTKKLTTYFKLTSSRIRLLTRKNAILRARGESVQAELLRIHMQFNSM